MTSGDESTSAPSVAGPGAARLRAAVDSVEAQQLVLTERHAHDRGWWREMADCYHPDAQVRLAWFHGSADDFVDASRRWRDGGFAPAFRCDAPVVALNGARAVVTVRAALTLPVGEGDGLGEGGGELSAHLRLLFRLERRHEAWLIAALDGVHEREVLAGIPSPRPTADPQAGPPSFATLARRLEHCGIEYDPQAPGDDRPDSRTALYAEVFGWAELPIGEA